MKKQQLKRLVIGLLCIFMLTLVVPGYAQPGTADTDGDGLVDSVDACPNEPGPRENNGCPLATPVPDSDGDGLNDDVDKCPTQAGPRKNDGCPRSDDSGDDTGGQPQVPSDRDRDGIADGDDQCPDQAGEGPSGCPRQEPTLIPLMPMPSEGPCVVSPKGHDNVNIREHPMLISDTVGILPVNALAPVLDVTTNIFYAEPEFFDAEDYPTWYQIEYNGVVGWVAGKVVRFGGDCSEFVTPVIQNPGDILTPESEALAAGYLKIGDIKGESTDNASEGHKDWIEILSIQVLEGQLLLAPYPPLNPDNHVHIDPFGGSVLVNDETGRPLVEIIAVGDAGSMGGRSESGDSSNVPSLPGQLDILYCQQSENPITEADCIIITTAEDGKADIVIGSLGIICMVDADGSVKCAGHTPEPEQTGENCTSVAGTLFCATEYLPGENCFIDPDDGHLICNTSFLRVMPLDPAGALPGLSILSPDNKPLIGLLLPAVQAAR